MCYRFCEQQHVEHFLYVKMIVYLTEDAMQLYLLVLLMARLYEKEGGIDCFMNKTF